MEAEACHAQVGVRATRQRREQTGMERCEEGEKESKRASLVDFMSLEPGVTASSPPATGKEKNEYGMWGGADGGDRGGGGESK